MRFAVALWDNALALWAWVLFPQVFFMAHASAIVIHPDPVGRSVAFGGALIDAHQHPINYVFLSTHQSHCGIRRFPPLLFFVIVPHRKAGVVCLSQFVVPDQETQGSRAREQ